MATAAAPARARAPAAVSENLDSVVQLYRQDVLAIDAPCDACSALVEDLTKAPSNPASAQRTAGAFWRLAIDNANTLVRRFLPRLPTVAATGGLLYANYYVWRYKVLGAHPTVNTLRLPAAPASIDYWMFSDGTVPELFSTFHEQPDPLPMGYVAWSNSTGSRIWATAPNIKSKLSNAHAAHSTGRRGHQLVLKQMRDRL